MTTRSNLWTWRPLRVAGRNRIAVYQGAHLVTLLSAHELDDAWALCGMRNLESEDTTQHATARAKARMLAGKPADPVANLPQGKGDTRDALGAANSSANGDLNKRLSGENSGGMTWDC